MNTFTASTAKNKYLSAGNSSAEAYLRNRFQDELDTVLFDMTTAVY